MDRILKFAARSAIRWHSTACCRHSTGVIIVALMTPHSQTEARSRPNSGPITRPESMCAGRFKISVARRQHSNSWRRRGPDGSGALRSFRWNIEHAASDRWVIVGTRSATGLALSGGIPWPDHCHAEHACADWSHRSDARGAHEWTGLIRTAPTIVSQTAADIMPINIIAARKATESSSPSSSI
jgi:hypothetical protein